MTNIQENLVVFIDVDIIIIYSSFFRRITVKICYQMTLSHVQKQSAAHDNQRVLLTHIHTL